MKKQWPTLYKMTSTGAHQMWEIRVEGNKVITRFGQAGGKIQETTPTVCEPKNVGRANATTGEEQALLEAEAQWTKKLKKDYVLSLDDACAGAKSTLVEGGVLPMLAHKYSEHGDKISYPAFVQPKLDGHRCIGMTNGLWSRTRKEITGVPHILRSVKRFSKEYPLDGELYNHSYRDKFEQLTHFIRQQTPAPGHEVVEYHVYDCVMPGTFSERWEYLCEILGPKGAESINLVETIEVQDEDEMMVAFEHFLEAGYEGAIVRNVDGEYVNKRSYDLQKVKKFDDAEFKVVDVVEGKGKMAGHGIFVCLTKANVEFRAKMKGSHDELVQYLDHKDKYVGRMLTVKYQGLTNAAGVPRFPVALRFAD